ncbi:MAG: sigma-70 family RNA polymerase sigma factor [Bacteroidales bacterium]|nr:sigma-70 family RNA polymerase sigma factor [Bacteroidales bacterium]
METPSQHSDFEEIDRLLARHRTLIERACWHFAGGDTFLYQELVQKTRIVLWQKFPKLREGCSVMEEQAWVLWQCRSVYSHHRRRKQIDTIPLDEELYLPEEENDDSSELLDELAVGLTAHEQKFLHLRRSGYTIGEVAQIMGMRPASASQLQYRIVEKMRKTYEKHYRDDTPRD